MDALDCYNVNLYKKIELWGSTWWIHIEPTKPIKEDPWYTVTLMNEAEEIVYTEDFFLLDNIMKPNHFINIAKQAIAEYNIVRKENLAVAAATHNFECYEGDWLEEEID